MNTTLRVIKKEIESLRIGYPEHTDILNSLNQQIDCIFKHQWSDEQLADYLKGDEDVLNNICQDTVFYEEVRNIQDALIVLQKNT